MMTDPSTNQLVFILYAGLFRLGMIAAGTFSLYLGYKLFIKGVFEQGGEGTGLDASVGQVNFSVKNAAPGSFFAICGVLVIASMFITGGPEWNQTNATDSQTTASVQEKLLLRGDEDEKTTLKTLVLSHTDRAKNLAKENKIPEAIRSYHDIFQYTAEAANNLSWHLLKTDDAMPSLALAQLAVYYQPDEPEYLDTLAEAYFHHAQYAEAVESLETAVAMFPSTPDPRFTQKLTRFREVLQDAKE